MGMNDTAEMLDAAITENARLEREVQHAHAALAEVRSILAPEWPHGRVMVRMVGAEDAARVRALRELLDRCEGQPAAVPEPVASQQTHPRPWSEEQLERAAQALHDGGDWLTPWSDLPDVARDRVRHALRRAEDAARTVGEEADRG